MVFKEENLILLQTLLKRSVLAGRTLVNPYEKDC